MVHWFGNQFSFPHPQPLSHGGGRGERARFPLASRAGEEVRGKGMRFVTNRINHSGYNVHWNIKNCSDSLAPSANSHIFLCSQRSYKRKLGIRTAMMIAAATQIAPPKAIAIGAPTNDAAKPASTSPSNGPP